MMEGDLFIVIAFLVGPLNVLSGSRGTKPQGSEFFVSGAVRLRTRSGLGRRRKYGREEAGDRQYGEVDNPAGHRPGGGCPEVIETRAVEASHRLTAGRCACRFVEEEASPFSTFTSTESSYMARSIRFISFTFLILAGFDTPATAQEMGLSPASVESLRLRSLGPALVSGRISDVAVDPRNRSVWYVGVSSGNVWKTCEPGHHLGAHLR